MNKIDIRKMCDKCLRIVGDNEKLVGFKIEDDFGNQRVFQGHPECVEQLGETIVQIYGKRDENDGQ
jgi:hypothetical protein